MTSDTVDFLMSQKDGANYVVLYQMLCLKTINTGGRLSRTIGEIVIPYDVEKIQRDCKWFSADTIRVALNLYKKFGLIYEEMDGTLVLTDHDSMVGTETDYAEKNRRIRARQQRALPEPGHIVSSDVSSNVPTDIRDKRLDIRDKRSNTDKEKENNSGGSDIENPYGETDPSHRPNFNTLEVYATNNLRGMTPYNVEQLATFRDDLPEDVIRHAIDEACGSGHPYYNYARAILNRYVDEGFKTLGEVLAYEAERRKRKGGSTQGGTYADEDDFY